MSEDIFSDCISEEQKQYKYKSIRGETILKSKNFIKKRICIQNLIECYEQGLIIIPDFQRQINEQKIEQMLNTFELDNDTFNFITNPIQLVYISDSDKYLLIDGQHRFHMYKRLYDFDKIHDIFINIINETNIDKILNLYTKLNIDNPNTINIKTTVQYLQYIKLKNLLNDNYKKFFMENNESIYSLDEYIKLLENNSYIDNFENVSDAFYYIQNINKIYFSKLYTNDNIENIKLNKDEKKNIQYKIVFNIKNNNFIELLLNYNIEKNDEKYECCHSWRDKKKKHSFSILINE